MEPKTLLDTDVLSALMRKSSTALDRARSYLADHRRFTISVDGNLRNSNRETEGDEGVNRAMFPTICALMREFEEWSVLPRGKPFRIGVVMHDSDSSEFWNWPLCPSRR